MKRLFFLCLTMLTAQVSFGQGICPAGVPTDICKFEVKVYTETDFKNTEQVRNLLTQFKSLMMAHIHDSSLIQDHLLSLGDQIIGEAYHQRMPKNLLSEGASNLLQMMKPLKKWESEHGQIVPVDWQIPAQFTLPVINLERSYDIATDRIRYELNFYSRLNETVEVEQFKISQFGGPTLIDKASGIGFCHSGFMKFTPTDSYFSAHSTTQSTPVHDGLYNISIQLKGQPIVNGWFFLHGTATTSPSISSPLVNEQYHTPHPTFRFQDFKSASLRASDHIKRSVSVYSESGVDTIWRTSVIQPNDNSKVNVGQSPNESGLTSLIPGSYRLNLAFEERSFFGDITVGRLSNTTVPFRIAK